MPARAWIADEFVMVHTKELFDRRTVERMDWLSVDGRRAGLIRQRQTGPGPHRPELAAPVPGRPGWTQEWLCDRTEGQAGPTDEELGDMGRPPAGCTAKPAYRTDLPTDPDGMLRHIYKIRGDGPKTQAAWQAVTDLLAEDTLTPRSRAALLRAVKKLDGVSFFSGVTDALGRRGVGAVFRIEDDGVEETLIFDPKTFDYLGMRTDPLDRATGAHTYQDVVVARTVVDRPGQRP